MKKSIITMLVLALLAALCLCFTACGQGTKPNGNDKNEHSHTYVNGVCTCCGDEQIVIEEATGLSYTLSDDGTYYIVSGLGTEKRTKFKIPANYNGKPVEAIGGWAFSRCDNLTNISIPNSVTSIGNDAFNGCSGLTSIIIPNSVTSIGEWAFAYCSQLTSITIPNSVTTISKYTFNGCCGLTSIEVDAKNANYISKGNCIIEKATKTLILGCKTSVIPNDGSVTSIRDWAFQDCSGLTSLTIPNSVTSISNFVFSGCIGLTSITIPNSVTSIGDYAFQGCRKLVEVINKSKLNITKGSDSNGGVAYYAFDVKTAGTSDIVNVNDYLFYTYNNVNYLLGYVGNDTELVLPDNYNGQNYDIYNYAFYSSKNLTSITIPNSVTLIGDSAFWYCSGLTSIAIPNSVTSIGDSAFFNCSWLKGVYISDIAAWCNIEFGNSDSNPLGYAHNLYLNNALVTDLVIPNTVTIIKDYAFDGASCLQSVTIPNSVTSIGDGAFSSCSGLTSIKIGNYVTSIGDEAFYNCSKLTSITIGNNVTSIGSSAFGGCNKLVEVINKSKLNITKGSDSNGYVAYYALNVKTEGASDIVNVDDYLFYTYDNANYLLGYVGNDTELVLPDNNNGQNYEIYKYAFYNCYALTSITIPNSVTSIGSSAFDACSGLKGVYINDMAAWCNIEFGGWSISNPLTYAHNLYLNNVLVTDLVISNTVTTIKDYAFEGASCLTSVTIGDGVTSIGSSAFSGCSGLESVTIGNGVKSIGDYAFRGCSELTSITVPDSVTSIGFSTFDGCSNLKFNEYDNAYYLGNDNNSYVVLVKAKDASITFCTVNDKTKVVAKRAFLGCSGLTSITIGNNVTSIGEDAFYNCYKLVEVINKSKLNITKGSSSNGDVGYYAISVKTVGTSNIVKVNDYLFYTYDNVNYLVDYVGNDTELVLLDNYNGQNYIINQYAFYNCSKLTSITIPDSVTSIGDWAFAYCNGLITITFSGTMEQWKAIDRESGWKFNSSAFTVYCTDGNISYSNA